MKMRVYDKCRDSVSTMSNARKEVTFRTLSPAKQAIIQRMQEIGFGKIFHLPVLRGEPVTEGYTFVITVRMKPQRVTERPTLDFILKDEQIRFVNALEKIDTGMISSLEIRDGLPCELKILGKA